MMKNWMIIVFDKNDEKILSRKLKEDCQEEKARELAKEWLEDSFGEEAKIKWVLHQVAGKNGS